MTTSILLTAILIFSVLVLLLVFGVFVLVMNLKYQVSQIYSAMTTVVNKIVSIEALTGRLANSFTEYIEIANELADKFGNMPGESHQALYRTMDGKYTASTLDQLMDKIKKDGNVDKYLSDDMENLRKLFESDEDDDDSEDGSEE